MLTTTGIFGNHPKISPFLIFPSSFICIFLLYYSFQPIIQNVDPDPCAGRYVYIHDLPHEFNAAIVANCHALMKWFDMCPSTPNNGFGPKLEGIMIDQLQEESCCWFNTNQFFLDLIFHTRMKHYECLTNISSAASAIFVPFYAGFDAGRHLWNRNISARDSASLRVAEWVVRRPEWRSMWGRDHFLIAGRIAGDFQRIGDGVGGRNGSDWGNQLDWGNKLLHLPEMKNMTILAIESRVGAEFKNDVSIPYPTYFHPQSNEAVVRLQKRLRRRRRPFLFSFVGADRPQIPNSVRGKLMNQCRGLWRSTCELMECVPGITNRCDDPSSVIDLLANSTFCLQPPGDSYTRRSIFDSILAGCIPVFFHEGSAYLQYRWHLPKNHSSYSVFIAKREVNERNASVEEILKGVPEEKVLAMREEVIGLIPRVVYADPMSRLKSFEDAFDIAVKGVLGRVAGVRRMMGY